MHPLPPAADGVTSVAESSIRVLHVQKVKGVSGSERHLLSLLPGLRDAGIHVRMFAATTEDGHRFVEALRNQGVEVVQVAAGRHFSPSFGRSLWNEIRRFKPALVHTHLLHADLYGQTIALTARIPAVSSFHSSHTFFRREPVRSGERIAGQFSRRTIAISEHVRDFLVQARLRPPGSIRVIPYGIDPSEWRLPAEARSRARAEFGLRNGDVAVGVASRLVPGKGHDLLLAAFALAQADIPRLRLLIAGDGPLRQEIEGASQRLGIRSANLLGYVSDIRRFMASCDVVVFPTLPTFGEGFGLAALEAMAAERPVIATRVASLPEIVADGTTGMLVSPSDPRPLAAALSRLAGDGKLRGQLGAAGRRRANEVFGLDRMVAATLSVYRESAS
jgi:glycosyltransferase involved in cell wall biosynthesis